MDGQTMEQPGMTVSQEGEKPGGLGSERRCLLGDSWGLSPGDDWLLSCSFEESHGYAEAFVSVSSDPLCF